MSRNRVVALVMAWQLLSLTGCTSYKQIGLYDVSDYGKVRVTFADGERIVSDGAVVKDDSIHYWRKAEPNKYQISKVWVASPVEEISVLEGPQPDSGKTLLLVGGTLAVFLGLYFLALSQITVQ